MEYIRAFVPESNHRSQASSISDGFDPAEMPIIAQHWFSVEPFRQVGAVAAEIVADLTFRRQINQLHARGPRILRGFLEVRR